MSDNNLATVRQQVPLDELIKNFVLVRDTIKAADDAHKERMKPVRELQEQLNAAIIAGLNLAGVDSVRTENGTAYRNTKFTATIEDPAEFRRFVIGGEKWDLVDWKANTPAVGDFIVENKVAPPGVKFSSYVTAGVRRS